MDTPKEAPIGYFIDDSVWAKLAGLKKALYGNGQRLTEDHRRDLANLLDVIMHQAVPVGQDDIVER